MSSGFIFVSLGFPLIDLRGFLAKPTYRLPIPSFPFVTSTRREFIRSSGAIESRKGGGVDDWPGEQVYGRASNAIHFQNHLEEKNLGTDEVNLHARFSFRRFYSAGSTSRIEVGMRLNGVGDIEPLDPLQWLATIRNCLNLPVLVQSFTRGTVSSPLVQIGSNLAGHYLKATTERRKGKLPRVQRWWLTSGDPILLVHYNPKDLLREALPHSKPVTLSPVQGFSISFCDLIHERAQIRLWLIGSEPESEVDQLRRLRIHLMRLHSERETLKVVLREIKAKRLSLTPTTTGAIQKYLDSSTKLLERRNSYGFNQESLLDATKFLVDLVVPGDRATILAELEQARQTVVGRVARITAKSVRSARINIVIQNSSVVGGVNVNDKSITLGDYATINGDFRPVVADTIMNSFNAIEQSKASQDLKDKLKELTVQVGELTKRLLPEKAEEVVRDLESFTKETTASAPRRKWYEVSAEGLKEAAKTVGAIASPVIKTVEAILTLLS